MSLILEVNGAPYENFIRANVIKSMQTLSGTFEFTATIDSSTNFPIKLGDKVRVLIKDAPILTGFVELVNPSYSADNHEIRIAGRDKTADVIDSSALSNVNYSPDITLKSIIERLLKGNNITDISVIDNANPKAFKQGDIVGGEVGQNLFEVIDKYAKKRQVLVTSNGDGNIVITKAGTDLFSRPLIHKNASRQNNILSASATYDNTNRFKAYVVKAQGNPTALNISGGRASSESIVNQVGGAIDNAIRATRDLTIAGDSSNTSGTAKDRAIWEANIRRSRSFSYECVVQGFYNDDNETELWEPNKLVNVQDVKADIASELLIFRVSYSFDSTGGSLTSLDCGYKDSFTLQAEQDERDARVNKAGANL